MAVIILAGGGTGGHVYPALAMGDVLRDRGHDVRYYGDPDRLEARVAPQRGYAFRPVRAAQLPRSGFVGRLQFAMALLRATWTTRRMLREDGADAVLSVGGYIAAPTVLAAWTLGIGRVIHEANLLPGMANKLCARVAQQVLVTFPGTLARMPGSAPKHVVGVPVNPAILRGNRAAAARRYGLDPDRPTVLLVGGSLGAARINELALDLAGMEGRPYQVLHLCGPRYEAEVRAGLGASSPEGYALVPYEDRMGDAYAMADLVVCRAGSATLAELAATGTASLLVPSPHVTDNHQEHNARGLADAGAAQVLVEGGWDLTAALGRVERLMGDASRLREMGQAALSLARVDAADRAADLVESVLAGR